MLTFECDYNEGCHPKILERLMETNMEQLHGYGTDEYSESARRRIAKLCGGDDADKMQVELLAGGTQVNQLVIDTVCRPYQGVISAETGHVNVHEGGAIEFTGHKVITIPSHDGKMDAGELRSYLHGFYDDPTHSHMVQPGMVYITHPTELGTIYRKSELESIADVCHEYGLPLFLDGARLGYGLAAENTDVTLRDIAELTDVFYIGGTKVGALIGEALVFTKGNEPPDYQTQIKQHGDMLAKGRLIGIQFDTLMAKPDGSDASDIKETLYYSIAENGIRQAMKIKKALTDKGYELALDSPTNQQFIVLTDEAIDEIKDKVGFDIWGPWGEGKRAVRFASSWATTDENVEKLISLL